MIAYEIPLKETRSARGHWSEQRTQHHRALLQQAEQFRAIATRSDKHGYVNQATVAVASIRFRL
jgi:hypothetical protein